jgi:hypothetical protein
MILDTNLETVSTHGLPKSDLTLNCRTLNCRSDLNGFIGNDPFTDMGCKHEDDEMNILSADSLDLRDNAPTSLWSDDFEAATFIDITAFVANETGLSCGCVNVLNELTES